MFFFLADLYFFFPTPSSFALLYFSPPDSRIAYEVPFCFLLGEQWSFLAPRFSPPFLSELLNDCLFSHDFCLIPFCLSFE